MLNGEGRRTLSSWIDRFMDYTKDVESPTIFRRWAGIMTIAAALEQKVWLYTTSAIYPNLYVAMIADPGIGKTRILGEVGKLLRQLPNPYIAPTSINSSSMIDHLMECRRAIIEHGQSTEYNTMVILVDELGTFMHEYNDDLIAELTSFWNVSPYMPYGQRRRGGDRKVSIERPQLNMFVGSTPSNLLKFIPEAAWTQGFTSRLILVFSEERNIVDDFEIERPELPEDLIHDLKIINAVYGKFSVTTDFKEAVDAWRRNGEFHKPNHPKLIHYYTRRKEHLYRLSMISAIDKSNTLILTKQDFIRAAQWLTEAEDAMPQIFDPASDKSDDSAIAELTHWVQRRGQASETQIIREAQKRVPAYAVTKLLEVMKNGHLLVEVSKDRFGIRSYRAGD